MDNVADATSPPCKAIIDLVYEKPTWAADNALPTTSKGLDPALYFTPLGGNSNSWEAAPKGLQVGVTCCSTAVGF